MLLVALLRPMESGLSGSTGALPLTVVGTMLAPGICVVRAGIDWAVVTLPELWRKRWIWRFWFSVTWNWVGFSSRVFTYRQTESSSSKSHRKTFFFKSSCNFMFSNGYSAIGWVTLSVTLEYIFLKRRINRKINLCIYISQLVKHRAWKRTCHLYPSMDKLYAF